MRIDCAVCDKEYARGAANSCKKYTDTFKDSIYFLLGTAGLLTIAVGAILAIYLVSREIGH